MHQYDLCASEWFVPKMCEKRIIFFVLNLTSEVVEIDFCIRLQTIELDFGT